MNKSNIISDKRDKNIKNDDTLREMLKEKDNLESEFKDGNLIEKVKTGKKILDLNLKIMKHEKPGVYH